MSDVLKDKVMCGVYYDSESGVIRKVMRGADGGSEEVAEPFRPFSWSSDVPEEGFEVEDLEGEGVLGHRISFENGKAQAEFGREFRYQASVETVKPVEHQYLLERQGRLFSEMLFKDLKRCQCDIETYSSVAGTFCNASRKEDRILAIGLRQDGESHFLVLEDFTDAAERRLLEAFNEKLQALDPDVIEGHNFYRFDLQYLKTRYKKLKVGMSWGRFGGVEPKFRNSRYKVAERQIDFPRCDIAGRTVFDTYLMIQQYDVTKRELSSYGLKAVARYFGISKGDERTYLEGGEIQEVFKTDRERFLAYLDDDLRETEGLADLLLPTYFAQVQSFPMTLQETTLRGTGSKVDLLFLERYDAARTALPNPPMIGRFEGGYSKSFEMGVFKKVLHFDVASLYPSLMLNIGRNPSGDSLGCFIPLLEELRAYRLEYKKKAKEAADPVLRQEYEARQQSYKILINSFYGYLGFAGARFADGGLAAEVTARGRELLQNLITEFQRVGCRVLEADTDGLYVYSPDYFDEPEGLLEKVSAILPEGIELEHGGSYESMFCYKAKNYALREGQKVIIRGSAMRSRGLEPFLKELTTRLIENLLGVRDEDLGEVVDRMRREIEARSFDVERLARSERLSQKPEVYAKAVEEGGKPRRASLEVALKMETVPSMGDKVTYYITQGEKKRMPAWQVARSIDGYDGGAFPYDPDYYIKKLDDWLKRYGEYIKGQGSAQQELL